MDFVLDNLAIGHFQEALVPPREVTALLCVAQEKDLYRPKLLYHKIPIADMQPIPEEQMREAVEWIRDHIHHHKILVFCNAGVGRAPSVGIGYLCCVLGYNFGEAVEYVATRKPYMSTLPNLIKTVEAVRGFIKNNSNRSPSPTAWERV